MPLCCYVTINMVTAAAKRGGQCLRRRRIANGPPTCRIGLVERQMTGQTMIDDQTGGARDEMFSWFINSTIHRGYEDRWGYGAVSYCMLYQR